MTLVYGVLMAESRIRHFGEFKVLVVERFDRKLSSDGTWWLRLPQEDLCQATATPPGLKYEADGGAGILTIMELLRGSDRADSDRRDFLRTQVLFWLLAAIDGHAKNFSIALLPRGAYQLAPRYDVLSAHPVIGNGRGRLAVQKVSLAMAVLGKNRHDRLGEIQGRHWIETARRCGLAGMRLILEEIVDQTPKVVAKVRDQIPQDFPEQIATTILKGVESQAERLSVGLSAN